MMRVFLAIEIPENVKDRLVEVQERLRPRLAGVRWERREKLHLTLVFLGEIAEARLEELKETVKECLKGARGFDLSLKGVGFFPSPRRPRVVWIGIEEEFKIGELAERLEKALEEAGFEFDKKPFHPHVTIGRVDLRRTPGREGGRAVGLAEKLGSVGGFLLKGVEFEVDSVVIMRSELRPTGSVYTVLSRVYL